MPLHRHSIRNGVIAAMLLLAIVTISAMVINRSPQRASLAPEALAWAKAQRAKLQSGKQSFLYLYETRDTDTLLSEFAGEKAIRSLTLELTDVTDRGLGVVAELPNLEWLTLYGGRPGTSNRGLQLLGGHQTLSTLQLVNPAITDEGLAVLRTLPNLNHLTLYRDGFRDKLLTDKAVKELTSLTSLKTLNVVGGWLSPSSFEQLLGALPECQVIADEEIKLFAPQTAGLRSQSDKSVSASLNYDERSHATFPSS